MLFDIVILAAGQGSRMHSKLPKVLHTLAGKPMLVHVIEAAMQLEPHRIHVVVGHGRAEIQARLAHMPVNWVVQTEQLGTGHAVMQALPHIDASHHVLVLSGDVPLIQVETLRGLMACYKAQNKPTLAILTAEVAQPAGLGRILRNVQGDVQAIVEEKDASPEQRFIHEIYSGICCTSAANFKQWLPVLSSKNAQGEYYLTDSIAMAVAARQAVIAYQTPTPYEVSGVNNRVQLEQLERIKQRQLAEELMLSGVTLADANRVDIRGTLECAQDVLIDVNTTFSGHVRIGEGTTIGPGCQLSNVTIGPGCIIFANSVLEECVVESQCRIGPFARIRPGSHFASGCHVGNFVEVKNTTFGCHSKANHLSYLGDAMIGSDVNIGAGTITCNYDGANKHQTIIENGVHIGSDTQLVAPVTIGAFATIGAGSTIRRDVPAGELTLTTSTQKTVHGWKRPQKKEPHRVG